MTTKKFSRFILGFVVAIAMMLTSCSKDANGVKDGDGDGNLESGYFALKIQTSPGTRAISLPEGTASESIVGAIRVVLYNPTTQKVAYKWDLTSTTVDDAKQVKKQAYNLLVIVNPTSDVKLATEEGMDYADYTKVQVLSPADLTGGGASFMMSNFTGLITVATSDIQATEALAETTPISVEVERAVAKIVVLKGASFVSDKPTFTATLEGWAADVTNKKTFWSRKPANTSAGAMEESPYIRANMYAEDPNFTGFTGSTKTDLEAEFNYITLDQVNKPLDGGQFEYVLENTMTALEQMTDVTTRVIIKAIYSPKYSSLDVDKTTQLTDGEPYYIYKKSLIFTPVQIQAISTGYAEWAAIVAKNPALADLQGFLQAAATKAAFGSGNYQTPDTKSILLDDLQYNYDGVNYYPVMIRHFNNTIQPTNMAYGRYGVVRNNIYEITVNSISGPGTIVVPGPDIPIPDDNVGFVSVTINILPWEVREQGADL